MNISSVHISFFLLFHSSKKFRLLEFYQTLKQEVQLRGNQIDFNFQLLHRLSKFEVPVVVNLKHIFELFGLYTTCFLIQKLQELIRSSSDGQFCRKSQNKKGGKFELRSQLCYYNCTVLEKEEIKLRRYKELCSAVSVQYFISEYSQLAKK